MTDSSARRVVSVPDVVGLPFHVGRDLASKAGVALANPDPDGPPIGALAWPGLYYIVRQEPAPGTRSTSGTRWVSRSSNTATLLTVSPLRPRTPPEDTAHAAPGVEQHIDLTDD